MGSSPSFSQSPTGETGSYAGASRGHEVRGQRGWEFMCLEILIPSTWGSMTSFPRRSCSIVEPSSSSASQHTTFAEPYIESSFDSLEKEDEGDLQAFFFSSFTHSPPCGVGGAEPFVSEDTIEEEAVHQASRTALEVRSREEALVASHGTSPTIFGGEE